MKRGDFALQNINKTWHSSLTDIFVELFLELHFMFFFFIYVLHVPKGVYFVCVMYNIECGMAGSGTPAVCSVYDFCGFNCELSTVTINCE